MKSESDHKPIVSNKKGPSFGKKRLRQDNAESADEDAAAHEPKRLKIEAIPAPIKPVVTTTDRPESSDSDDSGLF